MSDLTVKMFIQCVIWNKPVSGDNTSNTLAVQKDLRIGLSINIVS